MNRDFIVNRAKALLEEISPFEEPSSMIIADGDATYDKVKPIISYINETMNMASRLCLNELPTTLLSHDIDNEKMKVIVSDKLVGTIKDIDKYFRFVRVSAPEWKRDCTAFISSNSPLYLLQQNNFVHGGTCKPMCVFVPELNCMELYAFLTSGEKDADVYYIKCDKPVEAVCSRIEDFVAIKCAELVYGIFNNTNGEARMQNLFQSRLNTIME